MFLRSASLVVASLIIAFSARAETPGDPPKATPASTEAAMPPSTKPSTTAAKKPEKPPLVSPEIHGSAVTFRLTAPKAEKVTLQIVGTKGSTPLRRLESKGDENI